MTERIGALSALLDFYSDRAAAHASYFVAFTFGLFAVLGIAGNMHNIKRGLMCFLSWIIWVSGLYCLLNFGFFARLASNIRYAIIGELVLPFEKFRHEKDDPKSGIKRGDKRGIEKFTAKEIDHGVHDDLILKWKLNLMRRIFLWFKYPSSRKKTERGVIGSYGAPRKSPIFLVYWIIFALGSTAVFGLRGWYLCNFILLFIPLAFLLEDVIKECGKIHCASCRQAISVKSICPNRENFCWKCGKRIV